ncbi:3-ketoacyl-ACP reductase [Acuticoccus sp. M5D2P5]|uniref:3-ketoacyl-ACP reductase n=1 Tax=Acuticoccus kalidii TaxID=2910977 RepID=UPI001F1B13B5|nr:3-ketoacyl-ACP reductase [Acuticoccus kalidii]MCF3936110.1 3-ketoacyl-ACP reductase [Acuticoccus kalidii]
MTASKGVALVTGAARGIGQAIAFALSERGFDIVANDLAEDTLGETVAGVEARGGRAAAVVADIADVDGHDAFLDAVAAPFGVPTSLVNNAGISVKVRGDILDVTPESFDRLITVNLRAPFFLTQALAKRMLAVADERARSIITVSSANAFMASPDRAEYCISKTGLSMMTKLYALRLAEAGIGAYEIRPGVIRTDMTRVAAPRYDALFENGFTPQNRWGEPADVGRAAAMLAAGDLAFSTGEVVHVDGGLHIARL